MIEPIMLFQDDIIHQVKLSCLVPSVVEGVATRQIIERAAAKHGIEIDLDELQQAADNLRLINNLQSADETWTWLQKHDLSLDDFEALARATVISAKLAQHLFGDRIHPFFIEHQVDYMQAILYEVVVYDEDLAMELFYALQEGEISFYDVAQQYSQDREVRYAGGYRGIVRRTDLKPEISAAVFAATPPQLLKPIITSQGVHLIRVEDIIQPELNDSLRQTILSHLFSEWLKNQLDHVEIVPLLETRRTNATKSLIESPDLVHTIKV